MSFYCKNCEKFWSYPLKKCIYCGESLKEVVETVYEVIGSTEVKVPSTEHEKVPYFNYLLEDKNGNKIIIKSFENHGIGDTIDLTKEKADKNTYKVGVIGTGQMGMGITEYILREGHQVIIKTRSDPEKATSYLKKRLSRDHTDEQLEIFMQNLEVTLDFSSLKDCDIIIEAISEDFELKKLTFMELSDICDYDTIF
ncbi:MAG: 3-hydroxyacyl-CoA dehydrogenase NAD-binding domain-containing protein, partial [Methanobacterium sp.]